MSRPEMSFRRDMSFHVARRKFGYNIPATDIDFLEYDNLEPVLLWEAKSTRSQWRSGVRTASMVVQWKLARMANVPYAVVEHNDDWSMLIVCEVDDWEDKVPIIVNEQKMTLKQFVTWLYEIRDREIESELVIEEHQLLRTPKQIWTDIVPDKLKRVTFEKRNQKGAQPCG